jgi:hypothetical protein
MTNVTEKIRLIFIDPISSAGMISSNMNMRSEIGADFNTSPAKKNPASQTMIKPQSSRHPEIAQTTESYMRAPASEVLQL